DCARRRREGEAGAAADLRRRPSQRLPRRSDAAQPRRRRRLDRTGTIFREERTQAMTSMKARLALMMFLQFFIWGAWYVTLGTWLSSALHFSGQQIGWAAGTTAIGAIVSPFFVGLIADRAFAAQRLLGTLHLLGAALLLVASSQAAFVPLYVAVLLYALC